MMKGRKTAALPPAQNETVAALLAAVARNGGTLTAAVWQDGTCSLAVTGCRPQAVASGERCAVSLSGGEDGFEVAVRAVVPPADMAENAAAAADVLFAVRDALAPCGASVLRGEADGEAGAVTVCWYVGHDALGLALRLCAEQARLCGWSERAFAVRGRADGCDVTLTFAAGQRPPGTPSLLWTLARYAPLFAPAALLPPAVVRPRHAAAAPQPARDKIGEIRRLDGVRYAYYRLDSGRVVCEAERADG
ncbi:MAG: hypothetical protein K2K67_01695 [Treponemataceae bacterium]|nr:hypothetical protein [Treponemataceae bacterium]